MPDMSGEFWTLRSPAMCRAYCILQHPFRSSSMKRADRSRSNKYSSSNAAQGEANLCTSAAAGEQQIQTADSYIQAGKSATLH